MAEAPVTVLPLVLTLRALALPVSCPSAKAGRWQHPQCLPTTTSAKNNGPLCLGMFLLAASCSWLPDPPGTAVR